MKYMKIFVNLAAVMLVADLVIAFFQDEVLRGMFEFHCPKPFFHVGQC